MLDILIERFNYIPIIILMMTGLYVVIATGNLVKRLVGLSLFQTSVFLLYITVGKVFGGQPPIVAGGHHGEEVDHGAAAGYGAEAAVAHGADTAEHASDDHGAEGHAVDGDGTDDHAAADHADTAAGDAHTADVYPADAAGHGSEAAAGHGADHAAPAADHAADAAHHAAEILYSNPLPHVLILTAIVVGVATLAVGLALVVRIREAYGTIEDDDLNAADYSLETGSAE